MLETFYNATSMSSAKEDTVIRLTTFYPGTWPHHLQKWYPNKKVILFCVFSHIDREFPILVKIGLIRSCFDSALIIYEKLNMILIYIKSQIDISQSQSGKSVSLWASKFEAPLIVYNYSNFRYSCRCLNNDWLFLNQV